MYKKCSAFVIIWESFSTRRLSCITWESMLCYHKHISVYLRFSYFDAFSLSRSQIGKCAACTVKKGPSFVNEETTSTVLITRVNWLGSPSANHTCQF